MTCWITAAGWRVCIIASGSTARRHRRCGYFFHGVRNELFQEHSQSPLNDARKARFTGLRYYDYDPAYHIVVPIDSPPEPRSYDYDLGEDGAFNIRQFGQVTVDLPTRSGILGLFWIAGYGSGIFLPFRDATNSQGTYGGGRYLLDIIKGADLGREDDRIVLDSNYAYHPSWTYNPRWVCPLAPAENQLDFPGQAGELLPEWD